eukprot:656052-Pleurochrysis_carterae.AAC.1
MPQDVKSRVRSSKLLKVPSKVFLSMQWAAAAIVKRVTWDKATETTQASGDPLRASEWRPSESERVATKSERA